MVMDIWLFMEQELWATDSKMGQIKISWTDKQFEKINLYYKCKIHLQFQLNLWLVAIQRI